MKLNRHCTTVVLNCPQTDTEDDYPILRKAVEAAVQWLKKGKPAGVDNIPAELVQAGGDDVITALTTICSKIWQTGEWPTPWTQSLVITFLKRGNLQQCQNYRMISLISHSSKVMLKIYRTNWSHKRRSSSLRNRLASEQEGAPQNRSSTHKSSVRPPTWFSMQLCGQPRRSTSAPTLSESSKSSMTRPLVPSSSTAA